MVLNERELAALEGLLKTEDGKTFVLWLLKQCPVYSTSYDPATGTVNAFAEGNRNVGLKVIRAIQQVDPMAYPQLLAKHAATMLAPEIEQQEQGYEDDVG